MDFKLQTIRFNATEKLVAYIDKKMAKFEKHAEIQTCELTLKVVKPETAHNKEASLHLTLPGKTIHAEKVALCVDIARRELSENKENRG